MSRRKRRWAYWLGPKFDARQFRRNKAWMGKGDSMGRWMSACIVARAQGGSRFRILGMTL